MTLQQERRQILEMVAQGQITPEEAEKLLEALEATEAPEKGGDRPGKGRAPRFLRIEVEDLRSGKTRVRLAIPYALFAWGLRIGKRFIPEGEVASQVDLEELEQALLRGEKGTLVDVVDEEDGERIRIFVE